MKNPPRHALANRTDLKALRLRWLDCYRAGREVESRLPGHLDYRTIAARLGLRNHQQAHMECRIALGKVKLLLERQLEGGR